ncbi:hypothetical protein C8Q75DRAFT_375832 [Abortiporus biennis]|nr:hypothetical protein C8Q75DRAFT_375832 [Abortiporus biennis]
MSDSVWSLLLKDIFDNPRGFTRKIIIFGALCTIIFGLYTLSHPHHYYNIVKDHVTDIAQVIDLSPLRPSCSPDAWAQGRWVPKQKSSEQPPSMASMGDALKFAGLEGCASDREFYWHLGSDTPETWNRWPEVTNWEWKPSSSCQNLIPFDREAMVKDMVEKGGWLLIGDSVTENHFFSLSCMLFPHVRATPNYTENPGFDRSWVQNLYLSPTSPMLKYINFPPGFNISVTPLVSFRRADLLLSREQLEGLYRASYHPPSEFNLFSDEPYWSLPPSEYLSMFQKPLPEGNYGTLVLSTGGHWTTSLFSGFVDEKFADMGLPRGMDGVIDFFNKAMKTWADEVQKALSNDHSRRRGQRRQVVIRPYVPGHDNCHNIYQPWHEDVLSMHYTSNWGYSSEFNRIFSDLLVSPSYPDIHHLSIDKPALLRPDTHVPGDCVHIMTGTGPLEGWSHYIWHFISRELRERKRW